MDSIRRFEDPRARSLYKESLPGWWNREDREAAELIFIHEAASDEGPQIVQGRGPELGIEEASSAAASVRRCASASVLGHPLWYSSGCLKREVSDRFSLEGTRYAGPARGSNDLLWQNLAALHNPRAAVWLWQLTARMPLVRSLLFFHSGARETMTSIGEAAAQPGFDWQKAGGLFIGQWYLIPFKEPELASLLFAEQVETLTRELNQMSLRVLTGLEYEREYLHRPDDDRVTFGRLLEDENPHALAAAVRRIPLTRKPSKILMDLARTMPFGEVVEAAFVALSTYQTREVTDFFFDQFLHGSFQIHLMAAKALTILRDREGVHRRLQDLLHNGDDFGRAAAGQVLQNLDDEPPLADDLGLIAEWLDRGNLWGNEGVPQSWRAFTYTTEFIRYPEEFRMLADELRNLALSDPTCREVRIVSAGGSFGAEAYSLLMYLDADFRRDPSAWGDVSPWERIRIYSTDIDPVALAYAARGRFTHHPCWQLSDDFGLQERARGYGIDLSTYFDIAKREGVYQAREEWRSRIETAQMDVLNPEPFVTDHGVPDVILYNMVDGHLPGVPLQIHAARVLGGLPRRLLVTVPHSELTRSIFLRTLTLRERSDWAFVFEPAPQDPVNECRDDSAGRFCPPVPPVAGALPTWEEGIIAIENRLVHTDDDSQALSLQAAAILSDLGAEGITFRHLIEEGRLLHTWVEATLLVDGNAEPVVVDLAGLRHDDHLFTGADRLFGLLADAAALFPTYEEGREVPLFRERHSASGGRGILWASPDEEAVFRTIERLKESQIHIESREEILTAALAEGGVFGTGNRIETEHALERLERRGSVTLTDRSRKTPDF